MFLSFFFQPCNPAYTTLMSKYNFVPIIALTSAFFSPESNVKRVLQIYLSPQPTSFKVPQMTLTLLNDFRVASYCVIISIYDGNAIISLTFQLLYTTTIVCLEIANFVAGAWHNMDCRTKTLCQYTPTPEYGPFNEFCVIIKMRTGSITTCIFIPSLQLFSMFIYNIRIYNIQTQRQIDRLGNKNI